MQMTQSGVGILQHAFGGDKELDAVWCHSSRAIWSHPSVHIIKARSSHTSLITHTKDSSEASNLAPSSGLYSTMCYYIEYGEKYSKCSYPSTHVILKKRYDKCQKAKDSGYNCDDAKPAKGLNDEPIQLATSRKIGECPRCLS